MILKTARHREALRTSGMLTQWQRRMYWPDAAVVKPEKLIQVLNKAKVRFVVMGTHGIGGYRDEPRATQDVDLLIRSRDHRKAVAAVRQAFPKLGVSDQPAVTRFTDPTTGRVVIDLMRPFDALYRLVFRNAVAVGGAYWIPNLEMALASKFAAMISPNRPPDKKHLDAGDFINMVRHNRDDIHSKKLWKLAELVYMGGGDDVLGCVEDAKAGRTLQV